MKSAKFGYKIISVVIVITIVILCIHLIYYADNYYPSENTIEYTQKEYLIFWEERSPPGGPAQELLLFHNGSLFYCQYWYIDPHWINSSQAINITKNITVHITSSTIGKNFITPVGLSFIFKKYDFNYHRDFEIWSYFEGMMPSAAINTLIKTFKDHNFNDMNNHYSKFKGFVLYDGVPFTTISFSNDNITKEVGEYGTDGPPQLQSLQNDVLGIIRDSLKIPGYFIFFYENAGGPSSEPSPFQWIEGIIVVVLIIIEIDMARRKLTEKKESKSRSTISTKDKIEHAKVRKGRIQDLMLMARRMKHDTKWSLWIFILSTISLIMYYFVVWIIWNYPYFQITYHGIWLYQVIAVILNFLAFCMVFAYRKPEKKATIRSIMKLYVVLVFIAEFYWFYLLFLTPRY